MLPPISTLTPLLPPMPPMPSVRNSPFFLPLMPYRERSASRFNLERS